MACETRCIPSTRKEAFEGKDDRGSFESKATTGTQPSTQLGKGAAPSNLAAPCSKPPFFNPTQTKTSLRQASANKTGIEPFVLALEAFEAFDEMRSPFADSFEAFKVPSVLEVFEEASSLAFFLFSRF